MFETLEFKNVLSYGNKPTKYIFKNGIDLVIGSNGNGKSTFVDALTYGLFGKPFRKIKIGGLINNKNNKGMRVEVTFLVNDNRFKIIRGIKPDIFEIFKEENAEYKLVEKPSTNRDYQLLLEENIFQFGENVYRQLIALGANLSSSKNFMDLSKNEKEEVLQVITDTAIFNKIKEKVREQKLVQKTLLTEYDYKVNVQSSSISTMQQNITAMEKQNSDFNLKRDEILSSLSSELLGINGKLGSYPKVFSALDKLKELYDRDVPEMTELTSRLEVFANREEDAKSRSRAFISNEKNKIICPKCILNLCGKSLI